MFALTNFGWLDWSIVAAFMLASAWAGLRSQRYLAGLESFLVAGRRVKAHLGVASIIASEMGLVTVMYSAQKGFTGGFTAFSIAVTSAVAALVVGLTGFIVVPLRRTGVMTIPEYYERRYGKTTRLVGGAILAISGVLNMGMFLKADSLFITSVTGLDSPWALNMAMTALLGLVLLYTVLGGMLSVLVTDYLQFVIMSISLVAVSVWLMFQFGWGSLMEDVARTRGDAGFSPLEHPDYGVGYLAWMLFLGMASCALWQTAVVRASSAEDTRAVRATFTWSSVGFLIRFMIPYFWGICAFSYVMSDGDLADHFRPLDPNADSELSLRAMPTALGHLLPTGMLGVLAAGMLAAAMSTYNTYLHSWSMVLTQDVAAPLLGERISPKGRVALTRGTMVVLGAFLLIWGLWYPLGDQLWDYMAVTGSIYFAGAFAVLAGGLYWKRASRAGSMLAFACGPFAVVGLKPVQEFLGVEWPSQYVGLSVCAMSCLALVIGSLLFPDKRRRED